MQQRHTVLYSASLLFTGGHQLVMAEKVYIAADLGAESGRAIAGKFDGEKLSLEVAHRFLNIPLRLPHALCWNIGHQYAEILNGIKAIYATYGVPIVISTDDSGVSRNNLSHEYVLLARRYHPSYKTIKTYVYNSIEYSFLTPAEKTKMRAQLDKKFEIFEKEMSLLAKRLN